MKTQIVISNRHPFLRPAHNPLERMALRVFSGERRKGRAGIILAGSSVLRALNRRFRQKHKATDVLAFEFGEHGRPDPTGYWGEVYVNLDLLRRECRQTGAVLRDAVGWRVVHGLLHVFGYDHGTAKEAAAMRAREERYLAAGGFGLPWADARRHTRQAMKR